MSGAARRNISRCFPSRPSQGICTVFLDFQYSSTISLKSLCRASAIAVLVGFLEARSRLTREGFCSLSEGDGDVQGSSTPQALLDGCLTGASSTFSALALPPFDALSIKTAFFCSDKDFSLSSLALYQRPDSSVLSMCLTAA